MTPIGGRDPQVREAGPNCPGSEPQRVGRDPNRGQDPPVREALVSRQVERKPRQGERGY